MRNPIFSVFHDCIILLPDSTSTSSCGLPDVKEDAFCDDENNNAGCNWDGGYCCGDNVLTNYCTHCECLDPEFQGMFLLISYVLQSSEILGLCLSLSSDFHSL